VINGEDIVSSFWKYLSDNFATCSIAWPGMEFDTTNVTEWLEPRLLAWRPWPYRGSVEYVEPMFQINIFWKPQPSNLYKGVEIADELRALFEHQTIPVKDYGTGDGTTVLGLLKGKEVETTDLGQGEQEGVEQIALTVVFALCKG